MRTPSWNRKSDAITASHCRLCRYELSANYIEASLSSYLSQVLVVCKTKFETR